MVTKTINVYSYDELSENAKDRVREQWRRCDLMDCYNSDYEATLEEFGKICNVKVKDWEVGLHGSYLRFDCEGYPYEICDKDGYVDEYVALESLSGRLLFRYVLHNIIPYIIEGKYFGRLVNDGTKPNGRRHVKRYSRVIMADEIEKGYALSPAIMPTATSSNR